MRDEEEGEGGEDAVDGEMERLRDGELERWRDGETERRRVGETELEMCDSVGDEMIVDDRLITCPG